MNTVSQSNVSMMLPFDVDHQLFDECVKGSPFQSTGNLCFQSTGNLCRAKKNSCKFKRHFNPIVKPIKKQIGFNAPTSSYSPDDTMKRATNFLYQCIIQDASSIVSSNTTRSSKESSTGGEEICTMQRCLSVSTTPPNPLLLFTPPTPSEKKFIENRINQENSVKESFQFRNGTGPLFAPVVPPPSLPAS